jgi:ABC-type multidrug transport system fused ATPase/permease subunit
MSASNSRPSDEKQGTPTAGTSGPLEQLKALARDRRERAAGRTHLLITTDEQHHFAREAEEIEQIIRELAADDQRRQEDAKVQRWLKDHEHYLAWQLENSKSLISLSQSAVRLIAIVNAGAAVALLAFLGNALSKNVDIAARFSGALLWFAWGVVLATLVTFLSYVTQLLYGQEETTRARRWAIPAHVATAILWLAALVTFAAGCYATYGSVRSTATEEEKMTTRVPPADTDIKRNAPPPRKPPEEPPGASTPQKQQTPPTTPKRQ